MCVCYAGSQVWSGRPGAGAACTMCYFERWYGRSWVLWRVGAKVR